MRIGLVHSNYRSSNPSGENTTVLEISNILNILGHQVIILGGNTDELVASKVLQLEELLSHHLSKKSDLANTISTLDSIQIHNPFPHLSVADWELIEKSNKPVVRVVHNYRKTCISGTHFRNDKICFKCDADHWITGLVLKCYNDSATRSLLISQYRNSINKIEKYMEQNGFLHYVAISENIKNYLLKQGIHRNSITTIHNYVHPRPKNVLQGKNVLYSGRISGEKGIFAILDYWITDPTLPNLHIAGALPGSSSLAKWMSDPRIKFHGYLEEFELEKVAAQCSFAIFPCLWEEPFGKTLVEAITRNQVVLSTRQGIAKELLTSSPLDHFILNDWSNLSELLNQNFTEVRDEYIRFTEDTCLNFFSKNRISQEWFKLYETVNS